MSRHKGIGSLPEHFAYRLQESCRYSAISLVSQVHPVPAQRVIVQINRPAETDVAKARLAGESTTDQILQFMLLRNVLVGNVWLADDQNSIALS